MGRSIPGRNFLGGENFSGESLMGGSFRGGNFPGGKFLRTVFWYTLESFLGFQEKFNKRVRRDPYCLEYIPNDCKSQDNV